MIQKKHLSFIALTITMHVFSQTDTLDITVNTLSVNDSNRTTDWDTLWQSGFYEGQDAANAPEGGWFWGLNMNHSSNHQAYKFNGQLAVKNNHSEPTMYFRSTYRNGKGTWAKVLHDQGDQKINGALTANRINLFNEEEDSVVGFINAGTDNMSFISSVDEMSFSSPISMTLRTDDFVLASENQLFNGEQFRVLSSDEVEFNGEGTFNVDMESKVNISTNDAVNINSSTFSVNAATNFNGKVGIGTTNPKNELSVNGTIWAKNVRVRLTDAADWVFNETYNLRPLSEVKSYITKHKHLPEIPSADEFRTNDMEVSDMTNKLLQKIEELTLYTIDQEEQLKAQAEKLQKMEVLEIRLNKLEALLNK